MITTLTFDDLCRLDPELRTLEQYARECARAEVHRGRTCCGNRPFYERVKPRLLPLVGWMRRPKHEVLSTTEAYDVAIRHLYNLMPDCGQCDCI